MIRTDDDTLSAVETSTGFVGDERDLAFGHVHKSVGVRIDVERRAGRACKHLEENAQERFVNENTFGVAIACRDWPKPVWQNADAWESGVHIRELSCVS